MTEDLKDLHEELRNAMRREAPPAGFAERVLNRVAEQPVAVAAWDPAAVAAWDPASAGLARLKADPTIADPTIVESIRSKADPVAVAAWDPASAGLVRLKADPTIVVAHVESRSKLPFVQWAAAAALVAAVAGGFDYVAKQEQRAEGEAARERVVLALHIAGSKLQLVQTKINRLHEPPEKNSNQ